ncbi:MAG: magnesium/cobalt efflux protein, partial [Micavibrio aeruginosavorus]
MRDILRRRVSNSNNLQEAIDEFIEELNETELGTASADSQKTLITNILKTHDLRVSDVMVPRADIVAIEIGSGLEALRDVFKEDQFSRFPVYKGQLDNVVGILHIKDVLACFLEQRDCELSTLMRDATIVSPRLPVMELFVTMRQEKKHMALVVDEHGGIDGLVTINDIVEA